MSGLPEHDNHETVYSRDDVDHLVAREVAKQRMADLERQIGSTNNVVVQMGADLKAQLNSLLQQLVEQRHTLREEIEKEYATKMELFQLRSTVEKMWLKITMPISVVVVVVNLASHFFR